MSEAIFVTLEILFHGKRIYECTSGVWEAFGRRRRNDRMFVRIYTPISRTSSFYFPPPRSYTWWIIVHIWQCLLRAPCSITRTDPSIKRRVQANSRSI